MLLAGWATPGWSAPPVFGPGELVRLTRGEMLQFNGKDLTGAGKGQEFVVLKHDSIRKVLYCSYVKEDGSVIAVSIPVEAVEGIARDGWLDLQQGLEAFRDQRFPDARALLARAGKDKLVAPVVDPIAPKVNAAIAARMAANRAVLVPPLRALRDAAVQLEQQGYLRYAVLLDEAVDRTAQGIASSDVPSRMNREEVNLKAIAADRAVLRARQLHGLRKTLEAAKVVEEGLGLEPANPRLKTLQVSIQKDVDDADERYKSAQSMRRFAEGAVHALTAIEMGLKRCADHPKLRALKQEMNAVFEERTAPPVTPAFLAAAKVATAAPVLEEGHKLYTTRCAECHDLDLLDSKSIAGWQRAVAGMARRANIDDTQQAKILDYLAAAQNTLEAKR